MTILFVYIYATYKPYSYYFNYKNNVKVLFSKLFGSLSHRCKYYSKVGLRLKFNVFYVGHPSVYQYSL